MKLIQKTYRNHSKIDFALTENEKKPIDPVLIWARLATSCHYSTNETNEWKATDDIMNLVKVLTACFDCVQYFSVLCNLSKRMWSFQAKDELKK